MLRHSYDLNEIHNYIITRKSKPNCQNYNNASGHINEDNSKLLIESSIRIINDILLEPTNKWPVTVQLYQEIDYPSINMVSKTYDLNYEQHVMFCLAARAVLKTWLLYSEQTNLNNKQFFGYLGKTLYLIKC